jgi:hypothetical protein
MVDVDDVEVERAGDPPGRRETGSGSEKPGRRGGIGG